MKTYTMRGDEYSEFDINKRCAELLGYNIYFIKDIKSGNRYYAPCECISHTWPIIEKCWDELMEQVDLSGSDMVELESTNYSRWEHLIEKHNCTKLVAACICFIEVNS